MVQRPEPESLDDHFQRFGELLAYLGELDTITMTSGAHEQWSVSTNGLPKESATRVLALSAILAGCSRLRKTEVEHVDRAALIWRWCEDARSHPAHSSMVQVLFANLDGLSDRVQILMERP